MGILFKLILGILYVKNSDPGISRDWEVFSSPEYISREDTFSEASKNTGKEETVIITDKTEVSEVIEITETTKETEVNEITEKKEETDSKEPEQESIPDDRVNINTADKTKLMTLPMIGEKRAEAIISYREEHGFFNLPGDIMKVSGIGKKIYEKIKEKIRV